MDNKQTWKIVSIGVVIIVLAIGFFAFTNENQITTETPDQELKRAENISISIEGLYDKKSVVISSDETVLEVLERLNAEDSQLQLSVKEYSGLGVLVESMNGDKNGMDDKYWQYKVNGTMPQVGADKLKLQDSDTVEWYFSHSEF
jgi:hypothetical protein